MTKMTNHPQGTRVDYSSITPATGTNPENKPAISSTLANEMPTADIPAHDGSHRTDPDKIIPGPEAAAGVDQAVEERTGQDVGKNKPIHICHP